MLSEKPDARDWKALAKAEGTTLYVTLLAALQVLLYRYTARKIFSSARPCSAEAAAIFAETVGDFVNVVVLRDQLSGDTTIQSSLRYKPGRRFWRRSPIKIIPSRFLWNSSSQLRIRVARL